MFDNALLGIAFVGPERSPYKGVVCDMKVVSSGRLADSEVSSDIGVVDDIA